MRQLGIDSSSSDATLDVCFGADAGDIFVPRQLVVDCDAEQLKTFNTFNRPVSQL